MTQPTDKVRKEFETWWGKKGLLLRSGGGDYDKTFAYRTWQASRTAALNEAIEIASTPENYHGKTSQPRSANQILNKLLELRDGK